jgi:predicted DCC family thiol-disulfide oxidoreductase YuxK
VARSEHRSDAGRAGERRAVSAAPRHVALYDGDCRFCTKWRDRMMRRDPRGAIEWLSVHDPTVVIRFPGIDREDALRQMWVYAPDGSVHKGAEGWRVLFRVLEGLTWVAALYRIPGVSFVMDRVYRRIAARRYRLSCGGAACRAQAGKGPRALGALALLALLPPASVALLGCGPDRPDPVTERLQAIADQEAGDIVLSLFEAYGPYAAWSAHHNVEYTYRLQFYGGAKEPKAVTRQLHRMDLGVEERSMAQDLEGTEHQVIRVAGGRLEVTRSGAPVTDPAQLEFPRAFMRIARFTFLLPWNLLDAESRLDYRGERTPPTASRVPADECDVVRLTFDEKDTSRKDDWYDLYVSRVNHLIDRIHSYRGQDRTYWVSLWSDHRTFGDVRVATHRETHASDVTGLIGPLEAVVDYSDVRFDAAFGDEVWAGMPEEPAAADSGAVPTAAGRADTTSLPPSPRGGEQE